jgi:hypothetical protein
MTISSVKTGAIGDSLLAGNAAFSPSSYESIATVTVGAGGASSVAFTGIPSTYTHLQLRALVRASNTNSPGDYIYFLFNNNATANGSYHILKGDGSSTTAGAITSTAGNYIERFPNANNSANIFGVLVADILDYANTNKAKTWRALAGYDANGSGQVGINSNLYNSTTAVTSLEFFPSSGTFTQYSSFALYGIK